MLKFSAHGPRLPDQRSRVERTALAGRVLESRQHFTVEAAVMRVRSFLKLTMEMARQVFDGECRHACNHNGSILVVKALNL